MKSILLVGLIASAVGGGAVALGISQDKGAIPPGKGKPLRVKAERIPLQLSRAGERRALAQGDKKHAEAKVVPLDSIYYTFRQKGVKPFSQRDVEEKYHIILKELFQTATGMGASNVFMVRGDSISEAVDATWFVFCRSEPARQATPPPRMSKSDKFWLVAYLGTHGSHGEWLRKSAQISGKKIRLTYYNGRKGAILLDMRPYLAWVPLGNLEPGAYTLELFDEQENEVNLMRRVIIPKRK